MQQTLQQHRLPFHNVELPQYLNLRRELNQHLLYNLLFNLPLRSLHSQLLQFNQFKQCNQLLLQLQSQLQHLQIPFLGLLQF
jgi:hypothetical protein